MSCVFCVSGVDETSPVDLLYVVGIIERFVIVFVLFTVIGLIISYIVIGNCFKLCFQ